VFSPLEMIADSNCVSFSALRLSISLCDFIVTAIQSNESDTYEVLKSMSDTVKAIHTSLQQLES
jgi:hypothetical protein